MSSPRLPSSVALQYYDKAIHAVTKSFDNPTFQSMQALIILAKFALSNGQPIVAQPFMFNCIRMAKLLRLDVDPDDSPWLNMLTEQKKLERRRVYHVALLYALAHRIFCPSIETADIGIGSGCVKPIYTHSIVNGVPMLEISTICHNQSLLTYIEQVRRHHCLTPPTSMAVLLNRSEYELMHQRLLYLKSTLPEHLILSSRLNITQFLASEALTSENILTVFPTLIDKTALTLYYNTAVCLLHRSRLLATGFLHLDSPALMDNPAAMATLLASLDASVISARCIAEVNGWLCAQQAQFSALVLLKIWKENTVASLCLFEACVVLWFAVCRTQPFWWWRGDGEQGSDGDETDNARKDVWADGLPGSRGPLGILCMTREDRVAMRKGVADINRTLKGLERLLSGSPEGSSPASEPAISSGGSNAGSARVSPDIGFTASPIGNNMISPLLSAIQCMLSEMEEVEMRSEGIRVSTQNRNSDPALDSIVIGMTEMSLGSIKTVMEEPWVFCSLLGCEIGGSVRLRCYYDDPWRLFWANVTYLKQ
ncbi:hypothetical protein BC830DRAFT_1154288 [Chytriomyces sp. MP71]|nr:hypothetical protein BC830DRAFT_1154288 [Chytriomyces sp. MP71]